MKKKKKKPNILTKNQLKETSGRATEDRSFTQHQQTIDAVCIEQNGKVTEHKLLMQNLIHVNYKICDVNPGGC